MLRQLLEIAPFLKTGATISDVGSVKRAVIDAIEPHLPTDVKFVPAHPLAGTEHSGPESGFASLFDNRWCLLTDHESADESGGIDGVGVIKDPKAGGILGSLLNKLPPELRRAGRDVINQVKTRFPTGRIFGGKVFPPFF